MPTKKNKLPDTLYVYEDRWGDLEEEVTLIAERSAESVAEIGLSRKVGVYQLVSLGTVKTTVTVEE
jgi:hypothetical protein